MLNKALIIGHLGADPEMRYTANGTPVTQLRVAVNNSFTASDGERREEVEWFRVIAWNRLAETCSQYLRKGRQVYVEGRLRTRSWEGQDGVRRFTTELHAQQVQFLGGRGEEATQTALGGPAAAGGAAVAAETARAAPAAATAGGETGDEGWDLPF